MRPNRRELEVLDILGNELYGREIRDRYESVFNVSLPLGSLYVTLDRMESKGLLRSRLGESTATRGGNRRKYWRTTRRGRAALADARI